MKNIRFKLANRVLGRLLLSVLGLILFTNSFSAITITIGDQTFSSTGNSITVETTTPGLSFYVAIEGVSFNYGDDSWKVDDTSADFFSADPWIEGGRFVSNGYQLGRYSFYVDEDSKTIIVKAGGADGYISPDTKIACRRKGVKLHADNVVAGDKIRWAKINAATQDTLYLPAFDDQEMLVDELDTTAKSVRFYNRILRSVQDFVFAENEDGTIDTSVVWVDSLVAENMLDIPVVLENCGYSITADNASAYLTRPITMTCTFLGATVYRWVNKTTGVTQETTTNTLVVTPKGDETYEVYADDMFVSSIDLTPKSMAEYGIKVSSLKDVLCLGKGTQISSDVESLYVATQYEWHVDGTMVSATTTPVLDVKPTETTTYTLYADGYLVGSITIYVEKCTFFIASRYPLVSCLQDSNVLMAAGTAVLDDLEKDLFKWSKVKLDSLGNEVGNWMTVDSIKSYRFPVFIDTVSNWKYKVEYDGLDTTIVYMAPDCSKNVFCDSLEAKTLFYETFGYFMSEDVYVNNYNVYKGSVELGHKSALTIDGEVYYPSSQLDTSNLYYQAEETHSPLPFSVDNTASSTFNIRNFIAPDPNGYVVTPQKNQFSKTEEANCYVASDGHLFLAENPRLALYDWWGTTRDGGLRLQDGFYAIVMSPDSCDQIGGDFISTSDATGNTNGAMLFVNAGSQPGAAIYAQHVSICPDRRFTFGMDVRNAMAKSGGNPVNMTILLLRDFDASSQILSDVESANILATVQTGDVMPGLDYWHRIDQYIQLSEKIGDFWVVIYNNGQSGSGNDILIDDITFSVCIPKVDMVVYNSAGEVLGNDVVSCEKDSLSLVAHRRTPEDHSYFMFQINEKGKWVDMVEYDEANPSLALGGKPINGEIRDTIKISTDDPRYSGTIQYRVVTGDNFEDVWAVARGKMAANSDQSCAFSNNVSESIITIKNTFGGKIDKILNFEACDSINSRIVPTATRGEVEDGITWLSAWVDAKGDTLFAPKYDPLTEMMQPQLTGLSDSLDIKILDTKDSIVAITYRGETIQKKYEDIVNMKFIYYYEGGNPATIEDDCSDEVDLNINLITLLQLTHPTETPVKGCNEVAVTIHRNLSDANFDFRWYDSTGNEIVDNDMYDFSSSVSADGLDSTIILTVNEDSLSKIPVFEGKVVARPSNDKTDKYCFDPFSVLEIPFEVHNGHYQLEIIPSSNPVCITDESDPTQTALSLKIGLKNFNGTLQDSIAIVNKLQQYNLHVQFLKITETDTTVTEEFDKELAEPIWNLINSALRDYTDQTMRVSISSSLSDVCEVVNQDKAVSSLDISIREGGVSLSLASDGNVCLLNDNELVLTAKVSPQKSVSNIKEYGLNWYVGTDSLFNTEITSSGGEYIDTYTVTLNKNDYPDLFKAGKQFEFVVKTYDDKCEGNAVSLPVGVDFNGTSVSLKLPEDNCLAAGDSYEVVAILDSSDSENLIKNYYWYVNGVEQSSANGLTFTYQLTQASPSTEFKFVAEDGICTSNYEATASSDINLEYTIQLSSADNVICSTGSVAATATISPEASKDLISSYKWYAIVDGDTSLIDDGIKDVINLSSVDYPSLFKAGGSFDLFVIATDEICDDVKSDNTLSFDVNVPFTVDLVPSGDSYCVNPAAPQEISLTAVIEPAEAAEHIKQYRWQRESAPVLVDSTESSKLVLSGNWLSPGLLNKFSVIVHDGICQREDISDFTTITLNNYSTDRLSLDIEYFNFTRDRDTVCTENDILTIVKDINKSDDLTETVSYAVTYSYYSKKDSDYLALGSEMVTTSDLVLDEYVPGDSLYFKVTIDDQICSSIEKTVGTVVLTPFKVKVTPSRDTICQGDEVEFMLTDFVPAESEQYVKLHSWYMSVGDSEAYSPVGFDNDNYKNSTFEPGTYKVLSYLSDGFCYGVTGIEFGNIYSNVADTAQVKVMAPIQFNLISNSDVFCEGETAEPIVLAAQVTQGEPKGYVWANSEGKVVRHEETSATEDYFTFTPTVSDNTYYVSVYDNICNKGETSATEAFSVKVYQPFIVQAVSDVNEICLGDTVNFGSAVLQGEYNSLVWMGDFITPVPQNPTLATGRPNAPGEYMYALVASNGVCEDETVYVGPITVREPITVELTSDKKDIIIGAEVMFTANVLSGNPTMFEWLDGDVSIETTTVPYSSYVPKSSSDFTVYASDGICPVASSKLELGVVLPTAFTPHYKDGLNDTYMEGYQVVIFDRYGQKVFEGGNGWDGTHKGVLADPGVYYAKVTLKNKKVVSGTIEIVKHDK